MSNLCEVRWTNIFRVARNEFGHGDERYPAARAPTYLERMGWCCGKATKASHGRVKIRGEKLRKGVRVVQVDSSQPVRAVLTCSRSISGCGFRSLRRGRPMSAGSVTTAKRSRPRLTCWGNQWGSGTTLCSAPITISSVSSPVRSILLPRTLGRINGSTSPHQEQPLLPQDSYTHLDVSPGD